MAIDVSGSQVTYQPATDSDMEILFDIYASTRAEEVAATGWSVEDQTAFLRMQFRAQHQHYHEHYPDALWLIIEQDGEAAGRLYLENWTKELRIIDISLLPASRGMGIGGAILKNLMSHTAATGRAVSIHVEKSNPAMRLYRRLGFEPIKDVGVYDLMEWQPGGTADQL